MFAYASADAFTEVLLPCTWYVLPLAAEISSSAGAKGAKWAPLPLEEFKARSGQLFWRGSPNDFLHYTKDNFRFAPRVKLAERALAHPELLDATVTSCTCSVCVCGGGGLWL